MLICSKRTAYSRSQTESVMEQHELEIFYCFMYPFFVVIMQLIYKDGWLKICTNCTVCSSSKFAKKKIDE